MLKSNVKLLKRPVWSVNTFPHSHENKIVGSQSALECPLVTNKDTQWKLTSCIQYLHFNFIKKTVQLYKTRLLVSESQTRLRFSNLFLFKLFLSERLEPLIGSCVLSLTIVILSVSSKTTFINDRDSSVLYILQK